MREAQGHDVPDGPLNDPSSLAAQREARGAIAAGDRPCYQVRADRARDGTYLVSVVELPGLTLTTTARKGVEAVARHWIALLLELEEDAFDVVTIRRKTRPCQQGDS